MRKLFEVLKVSLLLCCLAVTTSVFAADIWKNPGPFPDGMDTWFGSAYNTSAQHDNRLRVGGWGDEYDALLRFNLSGMPQAANQAVIWLYSINDGGTPTYIQWYALSGQWHSSSVSWSTQPAGISIGYTQPPTPGTWYGIDVTAQYNAWRNAISSPLNYGFKLRPYQTNNNFSSFYSSTQGGGYGPWLHVVYTPQANDNVLKLKWPLGAVNPSHTISGYYFGGAWGVGQAYCVGQPMSHAGVDFAASAGNSVYAVEDGNVREVINSSSWGHAIVTEHTSPSGGKYTVVYWHVNPVSDLPTSSGNNFVPKGMQIATVADLGSETHLHIGIRMGAYDGTYSDKGALPTGYCSELTTFPENFINPLDTSLVIFQ